MKVLVTGTSGQLGYDVMEELARRGYEGIGADRSDSEAEFEHVILDITDKKRVLEVVGELKPDVIIHCAAWTNVDAAEVPENCWPFLPEPADGEFGKSTCCECGRNS